MRESKSKSKKGLQFDQATSYRASDQENTQTHGTRTHKVSTGRGMYLYGVKPT